ncbi:MAG: ABC transporter permease [Anaeromassilibacillus sp.]
MSQSFRLALKSIASSKMRSFLTMLGIIIGVASVILLVSLMQGMTNYISDSFSDLGTDQVSVSVTNTDTKRGRRHHMKSWRNNRTCLLR